MSWSRPRIIWCATAVWFILATIKAELAYAWVALVYYMWPTWTSDD